MSLSPRQRRRRRVSAGMAARSASTVQAAPSGGGSFIRGGLPAQPLWLQWQRIGGNLTPAQVSAILYEADQGDCYRLVQLANEARQKDGHLQSALFTREMALSDLPLSIDPFKERGRKEPKRTDRRVAEFVEDAIAGAMGVDDEIKSFDDLLPHLQGAIYHGHAVAQIVWRKNRKGLIVPAGFRLHNQRRFKFRLDDGQLIWEDRWGSAGQGIDLQAKYPGHYIVHQPRINGDSPAFEGLSRLLVWCAMFRNWATADWFKLAELAWKPWRIGKYPSGHEATAAGKADIDNLWNVLEQLTTNGVAVHRNDVEVDIEMPAGSAGSGRSNHHELCEFMGAEMSKAILGQTLTTEAGERGARSLGQVHDDVRKDIRNSDAKAVFATLRRDLIRPMVLMNFGDVPMPNGWFDTEEAINAELFGKALVAFKAAGMRVPERWAHDTAGVPLADENERVLGDPVEGEEGDSEPSGTNGNAPDSDGETDEHRPDAEDDVTDDGAQDDTAPSEGETDENADED
jgi:phage gp29-like protein